MEWAITFLGEKMDKDKLSEENFVQWKEDFEELKRFVAELPCEKAAQQVGKIDENVKNMSEKFESMDSRFEEADEKIDGIIGEQLAGRTSRARIEGIMYVLVPLMVAVLVFLIRNGV